MANSLVILAAGIGRRYGGLKQMDSVGPSDELIMDYSIFDAIRAGFKRVVFVISRDIEDPFKSTIGARVEKHISTAYVFQELSDLPAGYSVPTVRKKPWGTAHAVLACACAVDGPLAVINADDFYGRESYSILSDFLERTSNDDTRYCMVGFVLRNTLSEHGSVARGICEVGTDRCLRSVVERTDIERTGTEIHCVGSDNRKQFLTGDEPVSLNMWGFKPSVFEYLRDEFKSFLDSSTNEPGAEFFVPTVVNKLIAEEKVSVELLRTRDSWFGSTYREDKAGVVARIRDLVESGTYPRSLWD